MLKKNFSVTIILFVNKLKLSLSRYFGDTDTDRATATTSGSLSLPLYQTLNHSRFVSLIACCCGFGGAGLARAATCLCSCTLDWARCVCVGTTRVAASRWWSMAALSCSRFARRTHAVSPGRGLARFPSNLWSRRICGHWSGLGN